MLPIEIAGWLEKNFPIVSYGRIDWAKVVGSCYSWQINEELIELFEHMVAEQKISGDVIVLWSNMRLLGLRVNIDTICANILDFLEEDFDTWIFSESKMYCIENYHEGELCFGYSPFV